MKLGILVNTDKNVNDVIGLVKAAVSKGHEVVLFNMDKGIPALENDAYRQLCKTSGVSIAYCDHSSKSMNLNKDGIPEEVACGSQFDNANMMHDADKVIVL